jgi:hypothetical protein
MDKPTIFAIDGVEAVARMERLPDLPGIAKAKHKFWR